MVSKVEESKLPKKLKAFFVNKSNLNCFISILIIVIYLFLLFIPGIKGFFPKVTQVARLKANIIDTEKDWANITSLKKRISQLNEKINFYEKKLPGKKEIPVILEYLSDSASKLNVRITEIKPIEQAEDRKQIYYSVPILLKAECGYHQLGRFLNELERADRFMKISDIKIVAKAHQANIHNVQLIIVTYVMGQK